MGGGNPRAAPIRKVDPWLSVMLAAASHKNSTGSMLTKTPSSFTDQPEI